MKTIYRSLNTWKTRTNSFSEEKNLTSKVGWKNVRPCNQKGSNYKSHENEKLSKSITKELCSPVSGNLIQLNIEVGDEIIAGNPIAILNSMNIDQSIPAPFSGKVEQIHVKKYELVEKGKSIAIITLPN
ncbi:MAG: acetyl-CoA carboxylase biotin carboxyl carrier protein subunit [SAR202 cluster bacterium]|nr:acetyl-CoA carboxylase biotin carboxyl carrier protein subunit [SAR202 cluster bacterium]|tara:strand:- start:641 stop:1027 length:387 start_codon:yes stop_codon:yes gene_type:complete